MSDTPAVLLRDVTKRYGDTVALAGVDVVVGRGETVALLGPNGAGKTTTVEILLGLRRADGGGVRVLGGSPEQAVADGRVGGLLQQSGPRVFCQGRAGGRAGHRDPAHRRRRKRGRPGARGDRALRRGKSLSPRETEVLSASRGHDTVAEIADRLHLSPGTVRNHLSAAIQKLQARTRVEAVQIAERQGWL